MVYTGGVIDSWVLWLFYLIIPLVLTVAVVSFLKKHKNK